MYVNIINNISLKIILIKEFTAKEHLFYSYICLSTFIIKFENCYYDYFMIRRLFNTYIINHIINNPL